MRPISYPPNRRSSQSGYLSCPGTMQTAGASRRDAHSGHARCSWTGHTTASAAMGMVPSPASASLHPYTIPTRTSSSPMPQAQPNLLGRTMKLLGQRGTFAGQAGLGDGGGGELCRARWEGGLGENMGHFASTPTFWCMTPHA